MSLAAMDILDVAQAKYRYAYAADARDWDLYRSLIADPVTVDFPGMGYDGGPRQRSRGWWVARVAGLLEGFEMTQHVMSSPLVEETSDGAKLTAYLVAQHRLDADDPDDRLYTIGGRYEDRLLRQDGAWVFSSITLRTLWTRGDSGVMAAAAERGRS